MAVAAQAQELTGTNTDVREDANHPCHNRPKSKAEALTGERIN